MDTAPRQPEAAHKWRPVSDLPEDVGVFRDREFESLLQVWTRQREILSQQEALARFNLELAREWAVETGIIEGVYKLDRGITQTLIEKGIEARHIPRDATDRDPELVARMIQAHSDVLEGLFAFIKSERQLGTSCFKELHAALLRHQNHVTVFDQFGNSYATELLKGAYKTLPNNPRREDGTFHEYCPPEHVASEMDRMIALYFQHSGAGVPAEVEAAWLHHAFTQIHPFQDGNGRVARAVASLVLIRAGYFPFVVTRDEREKYIATLEAADSGDLAPLVGLICTQQKKLLTKAIALAIDVKPAASVSQAIEATRDLLVDLGRIIPNDWLKAKTQANRLAASVQQRFAQMEDQLAREISSVDQRFRFSVGSLGYVPDSLKIVARGFKYDADFAQFHSSWSFSLESPSEKTLIVLSFHGIGAAFRGILACSAYCQVGGNEPIALSDDIFRISYEEPEAQSDRRFSFCAPASRALRVHGP